MNSFDALNVPTVAQPHNLNERALRGGARTRDFFRRFKAAPVLTLAQAARLAPELEWPAPRRQARPGGVVYLASAVDGAVKIGFSRRPHWRMLELRRLGEGLVPELLIEGATLDHEHALHAFFAGECIEGEWFRGERLSTFIGRAREHNLNGGAR